MVFNDINGGFILTHKNCNFCPLISYGLELIEFACFCYLCVIVHFASKCVNLYFAIKCLCMTS